METDKRGFPSISDAEVARRSWDFVPISQARCTIHILQSTITESRIFVFENGLQILYKFAISNNTPSSGWNRASIFKLSGANGCEQLLAPSVRHFQPAAFGAAEVSRLSEPLGTFDILYASVIWNARENLDNSFSDACELRIGRRLRGAQRCAANDYSPDY